MQKYSLLLISLLLLAACQPSQEKQNASNAISAAQPVDWKIYGEAVEPEEAVDVSRIPEVLALNDSVSIKIKARALSSCSKKGCWMKVGIGKEEQMRVTFKDYGFFVPKDLAGEEVIMEGVLKKTVTGVEELRHYAGDAGATEEEIALIKEPKEEYTFEASGVLIDR